MIHCTYIWLVYVNLFLLTDELKTTHTASLEIKKEYQTVYEDLENAETKTFVKNIEDNVSHILIIWRQCIMCIAVDRKDVVSNISLITY